jgi:hypothetical protein
MELCDRLLLRHATRFTFDEVSVIKHYSGWSIEEHYGAVVCEWREIDKWPKENKYCWNGPGQHHNTPSKQVTFDDLKEAIMVALDIGKGLIKVDKDSWRG